MRTINIIHDIVHMHLKLSINMLLLLLLLLLFGMRSDARCAINYERNIAKDTEYRLYPLKYYRSGKK